MIQIDPTRMLNGHMFRIGTMLISRYKVDLLIQDSNLYFLGFRRDVVPEVGRSLTESLNTFLYLLMLAHIIRYCIVQSTSFFKPSYNLLFFCCHLANLFSAISQFSSSILES